MALFFVYKGQITPWDLHLWDVTFPSKVIVKQQCFFLQEFFSLLNLQMYFLFSKHAILFFHFFNFEYFFVVEKCFDAMSLCTIIF